MLRARLCDARPTWEGLMHDMHDMHGLHKTVPAKQREASHWPCPIENRPMTQTEKCEYHHRPASPVAAAKCGRLLAIMHSISRPPSSAEPSTQVVDRIGDAASTDDVELKNTSHYRNPFRRSLFPPSTARNPTSFPHCSPSWQLALAYGAQESSPQLGNAISGRS
jgi:hypothetical protein